MHLQRRRRRTEACGGTSSVECFTRRGITAGKEPPRHERHLVELFGRGVDLLINRRAYWAAAVRLSHDTGLVALTCALCDVVTNDGNMLVQTFATMPLLVISLQSIKLLVPKSSVGY
jgi:hypothetical protein